MLILMMKNVNAVGDNIHAKIIRWKSRCASQVDFSQTYPTNLPVTNDPLTRELRPITMKPQSVCRSLTETVVDTYTSYESETTTRWLNLTEPVVAVDSSAISLHATASLLFEKLVTSWSFARNLYKDACLTPRAIETLNKIQQLLWTSLYAT